MDTITQMNTLVNKLVEYKTELEHLKGFLFKDGSNFYIKIIDVIKGYHQLDECYYLQEFEFDNITHAESPKLMRVSMKSWHYRLVKYVLGSKAPTPKTLQNGCPYFWLLVFSMLVCPFVGLGHLLLWGIIGIPGILLYIAGWIADSSMKTMEEESVLDIAFGYEEKPLFTREVFKRRENPYSWYLIKIRYGIDRDKNPEEWSKKYDELREKYEKIRLEKYEKLTTLQKEKEEKYLIWKEKQRIKKQKHDERWGSFNAKMDKFWSSVSSALTFDYNFNHIIKRTKQFIGIVISLLMLAFTFGVVILISAVLIMLYDYIVYDEGWLIFAGLAVLAAAAGIIFLIVAGIRNWVESITLKYKAGKSVWYVQIWYYILVIPIKYLALLFLWVIFKPIEFIFYKLLWKSLVLLIIVIVKFFEKIWEALKGSMGIFSDYFGASKKDYCPGIEWTDVEDDRY